MISCCVFFLVGWGLLVIQSLLFDYEINYLLWFEYYCYDCSYWVVVFMLIVMIRVCVIWLFGKIERTGWMFDFYWFNDVGCWQINWWLLLCCWAVTTSRIILLSFWTLSLCLKVVVIVCFDCCRLLSWSLLQSIN